MKKPFQAGDRVRAAETLQGLAEPCTRADYTVAKLDDVVTHMAQRSLARISALIGKGEGAE